MLKLRKEGKSNVAIARELKFPNPHTDAGLVVPIIKFLLNDEADDVLQSYNEYKINRRKQTNKTNKKLKVCLLCGKEFLEPKTVTGQKYCTDCKKKYKDTEIRVLLGVKEGKYNAYTATEVYRLKKMGLTNKEIGKRLDIPNTLITPIIDLLLPDNLQIPKEENSKANDDKSKNFSHCLICGKEFIMPKGVSGKKYCDVCQKKYDNSQKVVLAGINEGKYDRQLAIKLNDLLDQGLSKKQAAKRLRLSSPGFVNPILEYLYYGDVEPVDINGSDNTNFIKMSDLGDFDLENYLIRTDFENKSNILIKGAIPAENRKTLFACLCGNGISVKDMSLKENSDNGFDVAVDLDVDEDYVESLIFELNILGFD